MSLQNVEAVSNKVVNRLHNSDKAKVCNNAIIKCTDNMFYIYSGKYFLIFSLTILEYAEFDIQLLKRMKTTLKQTY